MKTCCSSGGWNICQRKAEIAPKHNNLPCFGGAAAERAGHGDLEENRVGIFPSGVGLFLPSVLSSPPEHLVCESRPSQPVFMASAVSWPDASSRGEEEELG